MKNKRTSAFLMVCYALTTTTALSTGRSSCLSAWIFHRAWLSSAVSDILRKTWFHAARPLRAPPDVRGVQRASFCMQELSHTSGRLRLFIHSFIHSSAVCTDTVIHTTARSPECKERRRFIIQITPQKKNINRHIKSILFPELFLWNYMIWI